METALQPRKKFSDKHVLAALIRNDGKIGATARDLGVCSQTVSNRLRRNPRLQQEYETYLDEIVDEAMDALKAEIREGNTALIQFALDRLGKSRGFEKQSVKHDVSVTGDPNRPITIEKSVNLEGLSLSEKTTLMKVAKRKVDEQHELEDTEPDGIIEAEVLDD